MPFYKCKKCGDSFNARESDRKRGWARFCSKSCKAAHQEKRTGHYASYKRREHNSSDFFNLGYRMSINELNDVGQWE